MATAPGPAPDHLSYLRRAADRAEELTPFGVLRGAEARAPHLPRVGSAKLPSEDVAIIRQSPSMAFPTATIESIEVGEKGAVLEGNWLGLLGAMGPLPLHLTEYAILEPRTVGRRPYSAFLDVLSHRMLQLFYRAWASAIPAVSIDRPEDDRFSVAVAALTGAADGTFGGERLPRRARLLHAAFFASPRSAGGLSDAIATLIRLPITIAENVERWRELDDADRTSLGRSFTSLGRDALAGRRVCTVEDAFRVIVHVATSADLIDLLPGGRIYQTLAEGIDAFAPPHLEWEIELSISAEALKPTSLGSGSRLGWTSWLGKAAPGSVRSDTRLGASSRRLADTAFQEYAS